MGISCSADLKLTPVVPAVYPLSVLKRLVGLGAMSLLRVAPAKMSCDVGVRNDTIGSVHSQPVCDREIKGVSLHVSQASAKCLL